ncbi:MAG TPA: hypothetical protein VGW79_00950, partial [Actinomycetota bacterium]|nr:hypothetical protein [Actinomycetota bacterium]
PAPGSMPRRRFGQRGWVGLIGLLIALVIVALLAQTVLKSYGLLGDGERKASAGSRAPGALAPGPVDATEVAPAYAAPIERARNLEQRMQRDAQDLGQRIDEQTK